MLGSVNTRPDLFPRPPRHRWGEKTGTRKTRLHLQLAVWVGEGGGMGERVRPRAGRTASSAALASYSLYVSFSLSDGSSPVTWKWCALLHKPIARVACNLCLALCMLGTHTTKGPWEFIYGLNSRMHQSTSTWPWVWGQGHIFVCRYNKIRCKGGLRLCSVDIEWLSSQLSCSVYAASFVSSSWGCNCAWQEPKSQEFSNSWLPPPSIQDALYQEDVLAKIILFFFLRLNTKYWYGLCIIKRDEKPFLARAIVRRMPCLLGLISLDLHPNLDFPS